jgi:hypothetical protein
VFLDHTFNPLAESNAVPVFPAVEQGFDIDAARFPSRSKDDGVVFRNRGGADIGVPLPGLD